MPFELRPYPAPTLRPAGDYLQKAWQRSVYPLAARLGVEIRLPEVSPQPYTQLAHEGLEFAKDHDRGNEYNSAVMRAFFQRSLDIGDPGVLAQLAGEAGLDTAAFAASLDQRQYAARVGELLRQAYQELRITGVPYFVIGTQALTGLQTREALEEAIDLAAREG